MNVRVFTLRYDGVLCGFDDGVVREFTADKEVHSIHDHAFVHQGVPHLTLVVFYHHVAGENSVPNGKNRAGNAEPRNDSWRKILSPATMPLFNTLREWRAGKAKAEGVPPYFIVTNQQLAEIVRDRPESAAGLGRIEGIGKGKLDRYGKEILDLLHPGSHGNPSTADARETASETQLSEEPGDGR